MRHLTGRSFPEASVRLGLTGQARPPESRSLVADPDAPACRRAGRPRADPARMVPMGYRRAAARPVPWSDIHPTQDGPDLTARRSASHRWSSHDSDPARNRPPRPASDRPLRPRRSTPTAPPEPTRCAGSPPRSAAARIWTACSATSSTSRSPCSASTRPACGSTTTRPTPLTLVAQRGLSEEILDDRRHAAARRRRPRGWTRSASGTSGSSTATSSPTPPRLRTIYRRAGRPDRSASSRSCSATSPLGLLVLYHMTDYAWTADETDLARAFADHMATAIGNARLADSTRTMTGRLRAISELAGRLNRLQDVDGIAAGDRRPRPAAHRPRHDPGLSGRPRRPGCASRSRSRARSSGATDPDPATLRVADRRRADRLGRRARRDRSGSATRRPTRAALVVALDRRPRVDAARPDDCSTARVHGVIVVSKDGARPVRRRRRDDPRRSSPGTRPRRWSTARTSSGCAASRPSSSTSSTASDGCSRSTSGCCRRSSRPACSTSSPIRSGRSCRTTR